MNKCVLKLQHDGIYLLYCDMEVRGYSRCYVTAQYTSSHAIKYITRCLETAVPRQQ
jgi:hypothetical protein